VGPVKRQADAIYQFVTNPELTSVCAVAWPEEMPVNETIDLEQSLERELGMGLDRVFMNGIYPQLFDDREAATVRKRLERDDGSNGAGAVRRAALRAAVSEHKRAKAHQEQIARLEEGLGQDVVELPFVFRPQLDMGAVELLADEIEEQL
jgi:anion-transporting  ArsA/GET3 family ATPase